MAKVTLKVEVASATLLIKLSDFTSTDLANYFPGVNVIGAIVAKFAASGARASDGEQAEE